MIINLDLVFLAVTTITSNLKDPQPLVVDYYLLVMVLRVVVYLMLSLIFERSVLFWVRYEVVIAYLVGDCD